MRVIVENFDSNEMMYTKLMAGDRYDVIIPSDYMIERLMNEDFLQPLDKSMIPNMENMSDAVLGMSYDPDNTYSIPYFWGSVGLVYNHENVDPAVIESEGWEVLRNTDYAGHIYIYDSERDSFMMVRRFDDDGGCALHGHHRRHRDGRRDSRRHDHGHRPF